MVDTLRWDYLGCYGFPADISPHIDELAKESIQFTNAFSVSPWTKPAVASLFTSVPPPVHRVNKVLINRESGPKFEGEILSPAFQTMAEIFHADDYETIGVVSNPWVRPGFGFEQGFSTYEFVNEAEGSQAVFKRARELLENRKNGKPVFLYLHFMDSHTPLNFSREDYEEAKHYFDEKSDVAMSEAVLKDHRFHPYRAASEELDPGLKTSSRNHYRAIYAATVKGFDRRLGGFFEWLKEKDLYDNSALIFLADHGEQLGESHGNFHEKLEWGHSIYLFNELVKIPLLIRLPGKSRVSVADSDLTSILDIFPSLITACSLKTAPSPLFGRDLNLLSLKSGVSNKRDIVFSYFCDDEAVQSLDHKLIRLTKGKTLLYDLEEDPGETVNLTGKRPDEEKALLDGLRRENEKVNKTPVFTVETNPLDKETVEKLKSLGYLQ